MIPMSNLGEWLSGCWHICLRIQGQKKQIEIFHAVMEYLDSGWPWKAKGIKVPEREFGYKDAAVQVCDMCCGVVISSPRFTAPDLKAAAEQVGVIVKVDKFSLSTHCTAKDSNSTYVPVSRLTQDESRLLYTHKAKKIRIEGNFVLVGNETIEKRQRMAMATRTSGLDAAITKAVETANGKPTTITIDPDRDRALVLLPPIGGVQ